MKDANEAVSKGTQCLVVGVFGCASLVVEQAGARACQQGAKSPSVDGVVEAAVAYVAGQHRAFLA